MSAPWSNLIGRAIAVAALVAVGAADAAEIHVPVDHASIQAAIDAASDGDEVVVGPGLYVESIDFKGKAITLRSEQGYTKTTIDGSGSYNSVIRCVTGEGADTHIIGFTIAGGRGDGSFHGEDASIGGGLLALRSSPTVSGCRFIGNRAGFHGGGIYGAYGADMLIEQCRFEGNTAEKGAGIYAVMSNITVLECEFEANAARYGGGGIFNGDDCRPDIAQCVFRLNSARFNGGAIYDYNCTSTITSCQFIRNVATYKGGAIYHGFRSISTVTGCKFLTTNDDESGTGDYVASTTRPIGACCIGDSCLIIERTICTSAGGIYNGDGSGCEVEPLECDVPLKGDLNGDGVVDMLDMGMLMSIMGAEQEATPDDSSEGTQATAIVDLLR
jgi:predicted outer membrane repeat protein